MHGLSVIAASVMLLAASANAGPMDLKLPDVSTITQRSGDFHYSKCINFGYNDAGAPARVYRSMLYNAASCLERCKEFGSKTCMFSDGWTCYYAFAGESAQIDSYAVLPDDDCTIVTCLDGDENQACGGVGASLVWTLEPEVGTNTSTSLTSTDGTTSIFTETSTATDAPTATSTATDDSATSVGSFTVSTVATQPTATSTKLLTDENWNYKGCYTDLREIRSLKIILNQGGRWDVEHCLDAARAEGFLYAGLITGGECWGANEIDTVTKRQDASKCMRPCNDDNNYTCGGLNGLDVYSTTHSKKLLDNPDWQYNGCFSDSIEPNRSLPFLIQRDNGWTVGTCLAAAESKGYTIAALEVGGECWGGYALSATALPLAAERCNHKCNDEERHCGGDWAIDVYSFIPATQDNDRGSAENVKRFRRVRRA